MSPPGEPLAPWSLPSPLAPRFGVTAYAVVVTAMAVARQAGVTKLQMVTDPSAELDVGALDQAAAAGTPAGGAAP